MDGCEPACGTPVQRAGERAAAVEWSRYYDAMAGRPARPMLLVALERIEAVDAEAGGEPPRRLAVDLACGEGRDAAELLRRGWRVHAIDGEAEAIRRLLARQDLVGRERLETVVADFAAAAPPPCALLNAAFALPFCPPAAFPELWRRCIAAIEPGGRFVGQLFGERDDWAALPGRTHHRRSELDGLFAAFTIERLEEVEHEGTDALGHSKHWHLFHLLAQRRGR